MESKLFGTLRSPIVLTAILISLALAIGISSGIIADHPELTLIACGAFLIGIILYYPPAALYIFLLLWPIYPVVNSLIFHQTGNLAVRLWQEILMLLAALGILLKFFLAKSVKFRFQRLDWAVMALFLLSVYGSILVRDVELILYGFHLTYTPMLMYLLVRLMPLTRTQIRRWLALFLVICLMIALIGLAFHFTDPSSYYRRVVAPEELSAFARQGSWRMGSILANPLYFGILMALAAILSLALYERHRWYYLIAFVIFVACTVLSITRGAWFMLACGIIIIWWSESRRHRKGLFWPLSALMLTALVAAVSMPAKIKFYLSDSVGFLLAARLDQWSQTWHAIAQQPWGYGLGVGHAALRTTGKTSVAIMDGWYLKVLAESGLLGLLIFGLFLVVAITYLIRRMNQSKLDESFTLYRGVLAALVGLSLAAIGSNVWDYYMIPSVMWILLGLAVNEHASIVLKASKKDHP